MFPYWANRLVPRAIRPCEAGKTRAGRREMGRLTTASGTTAQVAHGWRRSTYGPVQRNRDQRPWVPSLSITISPSSYRVEPRAITWVESWILL